MMGNSFRLHSLDIMKTDVFNKHMPAAEKGNPFAAKECGKYFELTEDLDNAIKYYEMYLNVINDDVYIKMQVKRLKAKRLKNSFLL